ALVGAGPGASSQHELHHMAFEVATLDEVFRARDWLRAQGVKIEFEGRRRAAGARYFAAGLTFFLNKNKKIVRQRVLRGIALNRTPGFHFPGNFLDVSFDRVGRKLVQLSIDPGPWSADASGQTDLGALAILADLALGASIRAQLSRETRVATVSLSLQFTGAPRLGRLKARGEFQGF